MILDPVLLSCDEGIVGCAYLAFQCVGRGALEAVGQGARRALSLLVEP